MGATAALGTMDLQIIAKFYFQVSKDTRGQLKQE